MRELASTTVTRRLILQDREPLTRAQARPWSEPGGLHADSHGASRNREQADAGVVRVLAGSHGRGERLMRVHLLSLPNVQTTSAFDLDGFNTFTMRFARILKTLGAHVILYASEQNEAPCDELVTCVTLAEQKAAIGEFQYQHANISHENPLWKLASPRMIEAIGQRKQPRDYICSIGGGSQAEITNAHPDLMAVEYSIGYVGNYAKYRVFQSQAWRHTCYGALAMANEGGRFFDAVIPGFFDTAAFAQETPEDYVLYVGRFVPKKGIGIVCDAAKAAGKRLLLVGHGDASLITYGENLGAVDGPTRNALMAKASALICPTIYVEPFGCISPEAQMCGTPVISTDFGGFTETVEHGRTGYRCNLFGEFVDAMGRVSSLDRGYIRARAQFLYSMEAAVPQYARYFKRLDSLWGRGWATPDYPVE